MSAVPKLADVVTAVDALFDPAWAEPWDAVGLVCGDPDRPVRRVHLAVDPVEEVAAEAAACGADLLLTHHPLYLRGTTSVAASSPKGRVIHRLLRSGDGIGLLVAHTNADNADPGVSDALAGALGLTDTVPLDSAPADPLDKVVTFVPHADAPAVVDALAGAGAGNIGDYTRCAWTTTGTGTFRAEAGADPTIGNVGEITEVGETRIEMVLPRRRRAQVVAALLAAHPYEEPAYDVFEMAAVPGRRGAGRVGELDRQVTVAEFAQRVASALPATAAGVRVAGDPRRPVRTVAVCGGAGGSYLDAATRAGADAYVTADLRHHSASEHLAGPGAPALVEAAHWATEWPWLAEAARLLRAALAAAGTTVETTVSSLVTDPWSLHVPMADSKEQP